MWAKRRPVKDAEGISCEMAAHSRVAIYGIKFSRDNQARIFLWTLLGIIVLTPICSLPLN
jgi:hypothetical protein